MKKRCDWCLKDDLYMHYHDSVWGVPVYDDSQLFEFLTLEGAQAGLSWYTILKRREAYRQAFSEWEISKIARYTDKDIQRLLNDDGIIRHRLKIKSTISNARAFLKVVQEQGSFSSYIWGFVNGTPIVNKRSSMAELPASTPLSDKVSKDLKKRGFKFVGSTIVYAYMQAIGLVDDHLDYCWKRQV